jgi:hypothetical protein
MSAQNDSHLQDTSRITNNYTSDIAQGRLTPAATRTEYRHSYLAHHTGLAVVYVETLAAAQAD